MTRPDQALSDAAVSLRAVIESLPFPPVAQAMADQAADPDIPAMQALMNAARDAFGTPASAWEVAELQAMALAGRDRVLLHEVKARLDLRWLAVREVVRQLRGAGAVDVTVDDDAAALHVLAVGLGLAMLEPFDLHAQDPQKWAALAVRLLESLAAVDPVIDLPGDTARTWRARVTVSLNPTALARLLRVLSLLRVRVMSISTAPLSATEQLVDLVLHGPDDLERATIEQGMASVGSDAIVARGSAVDGDDVATRVLHLSAELVRHPEAAPQAVADLVLADSWEVTDAVEGSDTSAFVIRLQWTVEHHVVLRRARAPFTHAEHNRAAALLSLVAELAVGTGEGFGWFDTLEDGIQIGVRLARPDDADAVADMHARCSEESVYQRYFTPRNTWREENLRRISGGHRGATLVATLPGGELIALGNIFPIGPKETTRAELAVIVDDAWHHRGVGHRIVGHLIDVARTLGFTQITAYVLAQNSAMLHLLKTTGLEWKHEVDHDLGSGVVSMTADI